jgi:Flp pilus assembly protein CpaB
VGAIAVAAIAALMIFKYVGSIEDKASTDNQLVPVVVATGDIKAGETADALIESKRIALGNRRRVDLPSDVVTRVEDIKGESAAINMSAGEMITTSKFSGSGASASSSSNVLSPGKVAVTVSADAGHSVAGMVQPGDYVNLMVDLKDVPIPGALDSAVPKTHTVYLFQKAKVLAIGNDVGTVAAQSAAPGTPTTAPANADLVTLEVSPEAAPSIANFASAGGSNMRLVLVRPDYQPRPVPEAQSASNPVTSPLPGEYGFTPDDAAATGSDGSTGGTK